jgi:hypothetical protein
MSLHKFAEQVAAQGRGDDSLLVHMTPDEVQRLQKFAEANGRTMTINPETGLPEAGFLSDLFKAVAPIALGAFLGPAGVAFGGPGLSAAMAGVATGGITALATGSLSRGLMAGLGAYGGAGLGESLMGAGTGALSSQITGEIARDKAAEIAAGRLGEEEVGKMVSQRLADTSTFSKLGAGLGAVTDSGSAAMQFAKQNAMPLAAAAAPIMAGAMVPTTTKMPENNNPAYIRQKLFDPYTHTYKSLTPVKASEWGNRSFSDAYTNPQTGIAAAVDPQSFKPTPMNTGGIVALANGGDVPGYAAGTYVPSDADIFNYFKAPGTKTDAQIAQDMQTFGVSAADIARATGTQGQQSDYEKRFVNTLVAPGTDSSEFLKATNAVGLQNQNLASAMQNAGLSQAAQYSLTHNLNDAAGTATAPATAQNFYNTIGYTAGALPGDQGGLEGLYANINYSAKGLQDKINSGALTVTEAQRLADEEMRRVGVSQKDLTAATGKDLFGLFTAKKPIDKTCGTGYHWDEASQSCVKDTPKAVDKTCQTGYHWDEATQSCVVNTSAVQPTTTTVTTPTSLVTAPATALAVGVSGNTGASIYGGGSTVNPNGTITTSPVIPGIPVGGFTGMEQVRDAYTKGGGSLGYIPYAPKTMAEFEQMYNKQTGDSLAAYDYLMGKGGGKYPVQSVAAATGINRPYWSGAARYKPRFLTAGKDGTVTESSTNPNASSSKNTDTAELTTVKQISVTDREGNADTATLRGDGKYYTSNGNTYDVTGKQLSAEGGMMGYSIGGGLGSLGSYSDGGRLLKGPGDGVSDSIPAMIGNKQQPARLADGEFVIPARIVSELGNGSTDAGAKKLYAMMDRVQRARGKTTGKNKVAANSRSDKYLPA